MSILIGYDAVGRKLRISAKERATHMHIMGSSGSGKSKFLEWLIRGDLTRRQGFCLIDPHGTLYDAVVSYCAHHVLDRDIMLLNLSAPTGVIAFNPFRPWEVGDVSVQVDQRVAATMHAWGAKNTDETPTLARTLRLIYTVLIEQGLVLSQAQHLIDFNEKRVLRHLIEELQNPLIQQELEEWQTLTRREWREEILSAKNRFFRFLTSKTLCQFMGAPTVLPRMQEIMDRGTILLVNLRRSDYLSEENARVFGALLVNEFFEAAFRRTRGALGGDPDPYYLYLDEFQNFVSVDLADMLDQVRKFGLYMVLAHQRFGQIDENIIEAALSHCRIRAVFGGLTVPNARRMAEELFIGKLDPTRVKVAIYQTKFWPEYQRDKVYTTGSSYASSHVHGRHSGSGVFQGGGAGDFFQAGDWVGNPGTYGSSHSWNSGSSNLDGTSDIDGSSTVDSDSEADIPIFVPVPFKELSSVQYYAPEEQLIELTAALKRQYPRHCFIEIHDRDAQPMLVPFVENAYTTPSNARWYIERVLNQGNAVPTEEVGRHLAELDRQLLGAADGIAMDGSRRRSTVSANTLPEDYRE